MGNLIVKRKAIPKKTRLKVYEMYEGHCAYCGCEIEYKEMQVDHFKSLYGQDGADEIENYKPACRMCNFYKNTYDLETFRGELGKIKSRLEKEFIYRLSRKYGLVEEVDKDIKFYFEEFDTNKIL